MREGRRNTQGTAERRAELLDALADHVQRVGLAGTSYRTLAQAAGVQHNTLTHHFGSRTELLAAVFERISERMSAPSPSATDRSERLNEMWELLTAPAFWTLWPTFFEVVGAAMRDPEQHAVLLRHVTEDWTRRVADQGIAEGMDEREAMATATFVVASVRGLALDLCSGGDPQRVADGLQVLSAVVSAYAPGTFRT